MAHFGHNGKKQNQRSGGGGGKGGPPALPTTFEIADARCKICNSPVRREVDMMLTTGWSQADVWRWLNTTFGIPEDPEPYTRKNVSTHKNNHLSLADATTRKIIETRAKQAGLDVEDASGFILTQTAVAEMILHQGIRYLQHGVIIPEVKDILATMAQLRELEGENRDIAVDEMLAEFNAFSVAVKFVLTKYLGEDKAEEWFQEIFEEFERLLDERKPKALAPAEPDAADEEIEDGEYEETQ